MTTRHSTLASSWRSQEGIALPTALIGILILSGLAIILIGFARMELRATSESTSFEVGIHVAETAAELAIAALADPEQTQRPFSAPDEPPGSPDGDRQWAVDHARTQVNAASCSNVVRTAGGEGFAVVDGANSVVYGIGFIPSCESSSLTRVMRVSFDTRPVDPLDADVTVLTGGDLHISGSNVRLTGGVHSNGSIFGTFSSARSPVPMTYAGDSCTDDRCAEGPPRNVPNLSARAFWEARNEYGVNPENAPFRELCPNGTIRESPSASIPVWESGQADPCLSGGPGCPCTGEEVTPTPEGWVWYDGTTSTYQGYEGRDWGPTWLWDRNYGPPDGIYYGYRVNIASNDNSGQGTSGQATFLSEADRAGLAINGSDSGNVHFTSNAKIYPAWQGVAVVADVDVTFEGNPHHFGTTSLIFAREQFAITQNPTISGMFFIACDAAIVENVNPAFDPKAAYCPDNPNPTSTPNSPVSRSEIFANATLQAPGDDDILIPNLGLAGVAEWENLFGS